VTLTLVAAASHRRYIFHRTHLGLGLDLFQVALSLIACGFYVVETYIDMENVRWWKLTEMIFTINFLFDYIFRFYVAKDKMVYYFSPMALVDFVTVVPPLVWAVLVISGTTQLQFLRVLRLLRALRVLRVLKIMRMFSSNLYADLSVTRMAVKVGFTCFCLIFSTACFFSLTEELPFHISLYYMTIEALGRPNVPVMTVSGFMLAYVLITLSVVIVPQQVAQLVSVWSKNRGEREEYKKKVGEDHIMICGSINPQIFRDFVQDIYAVPENYIKACVITPVELSPYLTSLLDQPPYADFVKVIEGSVLVEEDLLRVNAPSASRIFVMSRVVIEDKATEDHITLTRVMSLKRYCPGVPICCVVLLPQNKERVMNLKSWDRQKDTCVCVESLKLTLMGLNFLCSGASTLVTNLCGSSGASEINLLASPEDLQEEEIWKQEYLEGVTMAFASLPAPKATHGRRWQEVVLMLYEQYQVLAVAVEDGDSGFCTNPTAYTVQSGDQFAVISCNMMILERITRELNGAKTGRAESADISPAAVSSNPRAANRNPPAGRSRLVSDGTWLDTPPVGPMQSPTVGPDEVSIELVPPRRTAALCLDAATQQRMAYEADPESTHRSSSGGDPRRLPALGTFCEEHYGGDMQAMLRDVSDATGIPLGPCDSLMSTPADDDEPSRLPPEGEAVKHVLLCGWSDSLQYITRLLLPEAIHVTILCPQVPSATQMASLRQGLANGETHLHHIEGNSTQISALKKARVHEKQAVIMLGKEKIGKASGQTALVDDLIHDTDVILGHNLVCGIARGIQPITELTHSSSVSYLDDNTKPTPNPRGDDLDQALGKGNNLVEVITKGVQQKAVKREKNALREQKSGVAFAAGQVYTNMLSTVLMAKAQTMPSIASLIKTFVYGLKKVDESRNLRISHILTQIPIPTAARQCCITYGDLVSFMLEQEDHDIPIGLYRAPDETRGNTAPYVYTNPRSSVVLGPGDKLFVLVNSSVAMAGTRRPLASNVRPAGTATLRIPPSTATGEQAAGGEGGGTLPRFGGMVSPGFDPQDADAVSPARQDGTNLKLE